MGVKIIGILGVLDAEGSSLLGNDKMFLAEFGGASFKQEGTVCLGDVHAVLADFHRFNQLVDSLVLPVQIQFDEGASRRVFVAEPTCEFICNKVLEECLVGGISDKCPVFILGHPEHFLFFREFNFVAGLGHSRKTGVAAPLDGQFKNVAFGRVLAVYLQLCGNLGFAVANLREVLGLDDKSRQAYVGVFRIVNR